MPKKDNSFAEYVVHDLLGHIPEITYKAMFGGCSVYKNGVTFGLIANDKLYFKVDELNKAEYEEYKSKPFTYRSKKGKEYSMSYWELPQEIMDDRDELRLWVDKSCRVSLSKKK